MSGHALGGNRAPNTLLEKVIEIQKNFTALHDRAWWLNNQLMFSPRLQKIISPKHNRLAKPRNIFCIGTSSINNPCNSISVIYSIQTLSCMRFIPIQSCLFEPIIDWNFNKLTRLQTRTLTNHYKSNFAVECGAVAFVCEIRCVHHSRMFTHSGSNNAPLKETVVRDSYGKSCTI